MILIESRQNAALRHLARLGREKKYRQQTGEMVCEGEKLLREALSSGAIVTTLLLRASGAIEDSLLRRAEAAGARLYLASAALFAQVSGVQTPQDVIFSCKTPGQAPDTLQSATRVLLLDGVQDPGNVGTILRTADAFALDAVVLCEGCADVSSPKVVRATMGALFRLPLVSLPLEGAVQALREAELPVYAAALQENSLRAGDVDLHRCAVIIGSEGHGVSEQALALADKTLLIPMCGRAESLNAGVAAAILMWEMTK